MKRILFSLSVVGALFAFTASLTAAGGKSLLSKQVANLAKNVVSSFQESVSDKYKNNLAVFPLQEEGSEAKEKGVGAVASSILVTELKKTGEFDIIDRENIDKALEEMEMSMTGLVDPEQAVEVGKMAAANIFLSGNISATETTYIINVQMTEVETGEVILAETVEFPKDVINHMATLMYVEAKSPVTAGFRSAVVPGWGQIYNDQSVKGGVILGGALLAGGMAIFSGVNMRFAKEEGDYWRQVYDSWPSWDQQEIDDNMDYATESYSYMTGAYNRANTFATIATGSLILFGTVWLYGVIDGIVNARIRLRKIEGAKDALAYTDGTALFPSYAILPYWNVPDEELGLSFVVNF